MKLPLDIFQLMGVTPNADEKKILTILEKRLNAADLQDYSEECLQKRGEILVEISKILMDPQKRQEYDELLMADDSYLKNDFEIPSGSEVAGLLLLLEAEQPKECRVLGNYLLERRKSDVVVPRTFYKDLALVMDRAALSYAGELAGKRYYESAAQVIKERIQETNNLSVRDSKELVAKLDELLPYRILDLLNRNCSDDSHKQGIGLLEKLVEERGGLENDSSKYMNNQEFKSFFRQIRGLLTVQEQIDLFKKWNSDGSSLAGFLAAIALVAAGFAQRKPERLKEALSILDSIDTKDLETIKANIYLLLGNVERSNGLLTQYASEELEKWCSEIDENRLGQQCAWCKEWLDRDVLDGYRDIEADPDLEAYFCDRDVLEYIESEDINRDKWIGQRKIGQEHSDFKLREGTPMVENVYKSGSAPSLHTMIKPFIPSLNKPTGLNKREKRVLYGIGASTMTALLLIVFIITKTQKEVRVGSESRITAEERSNQHTELKNMSGSTEELKQDEIFKVLYGWLALKVATLSGEELPADARKYASLEQINRLRRERKIDEEKGEKQLIDVSVKKIRLIQKSTNRVQVQATLEYSDKRLDRNGEVISITPRHIFKKNYTLINDGKDWVLD